MSWLTDPVNLTLAATIVLIAVVLWRAQRRDDFDFAQFLRDESGALSSFRLIGFGAYAASTWVLMRYAVTYAVPEWMWWGYVAAFSGSAVVAKLAEAWAARGRQ